MKFWKEMRNSWIAVLVVLVFAAEVHGENEIQVRVTPRSGPLCGGGSPVDLFFDAGTDFTVDIAACTGLVNIFAHETTADNIGRVTINGLVSTGNTLGIKIGAGSFPINTNSFTTACHDFGGLAFTDFLQAGRTKFAGHIGGDLTDSIDVKALILFEVDGAILDNVRADVDSSGFFHVIAGSVGQGASIICTNATIDLVRVNGDMEGGSNPSINRCRK